MQNKHSDPIGAAISDYHKHGKANDIIVHSDIAENDLIPTAYLFRSFEEMPEIEKKAIDLCRGKVLDIGAGAGPHASCLKEKLLEVSPIDTSSGAIEVLKKKGFPDAKCMNIMELQNEKYDTLLLLMNGIGMAGKLNQLPRFLKHLKSLLRPNGQILIESTDLIYLFMEEDGSILMDANKKYYGEVKYWMEYNKIKGKPFNWLFVDFNTLQEKAKKIGLRAERILSGKNNEYLAKLSF